MTVIGQDPFSYSALRMDDQASRATSRQPRANGRGRVGPPSPVSPSGGRSTSPGIKPIPNSLYPSLSAYRSRRWLLEQARLVQHRSHRTASETESARCERVQRPITMPRGRLTYDYRNQFTTRSARDGATTDRKQQRRRDSARQPRLAMRSPRPLRRHRMPSHTSPDSGSRISRQWQPYLQTVAAASPDRGNQQPTLQAVVSHNQPILSQGHPQSQSARAFNSINHAHIRVFGASRLYIH